jgi:hypothetical protein
MTERRTGKITMGKKLTHAEVALRFEKKGFILLSEYKNCRTKLKYRCPNGHEWSTFLNNFYRWGCPICSKNKKHEYSEVKKMFKKKGYTLLSTKYKNTRNRLKYKCRRGHITYISVNQLREGKGCRECWYKYELPKLREGEKHPMWKPKLTEEDREKNKRRYGKYLNWKKAVLERDNYTCQITKQTGTVVVHHLDGYAKFKDKRYDLENGVTLLDSIHTLFHRYYNNRNNTKEQFIEFVNLYKEVLT